MQITLRKQVECDHNSVENKGLKENGPNCQQWLPLCSRILGDVLYTFHSVQSFQNYLHIVCAKSLSRVQFFATL